MELPHILPSRAASKMTYIVSGGALNSTHSLTHSLCTPVQVCYHIDFMCVCLQLTKCVCVDRQSNTGWTTYEGHFGRLLKLQAQLVTAHGRSLLFAVLSSADVIIVYSYILSETQWRSKVGAGLPAPLHSFSHRVRLRRRALHALHTLLLRHRTDKTMFANSTNELKCFKRLNMTICSVVGCK